LRTSAAGKGCSPEWTEFLEHPNYDAYWQARNTRPHLKNVHCAVMTVGGWYDAEDLFGALETYRWTERQNPGITNILVMGPWAHGGWGSQDGDALGDISFHAKTAEYYREKIELPFFRHFLKGDTNYTATEAQVFETGTDQWRRFDAWPPRQAVARTLYLHAGGSLDFNPPADAAEAFDEQLLQRNGQDGPAFGAQLLSEAEHVVPELELFTGQVRQDGEAVVPHRADARAFLGEKVALEGGHGLVEVAEVRFLRHDSTSRAQTERTGWSQSISVKCIMLRMRRPGSVRARESKRSSSRPTERRYGLAVSVPSKRVSRSR